MDLGKYNVITGYNGAGKSNLVRTLKLVIADRHNGFDTCYIEDDQKFKKYDSSWIKIRIRLSTEEVSLISSLIFRNKERKIEEAEFALLWEGLRNYQEIKYAFILENKLIIWKDGRQTKIGILEIKESVFDDLFIHLKGIRNITAEETRAITGFEGDNYGRIVQEKNFQDLFFSAERDIEKYFLVNGERVCGIYNQDRQRKFDENICEHCGLSFNKGSVNLWILLANIFYRNFIIITEFRPSVQQLKEDINDLKSKANIGVIRELQDSFTSVFPDYSFDIESDTEIHFAITRGESKFRIENSASGYIEVLYMLNLLRRDVQGIVILDEPALHLHPIKQKHFWKVVSEKNHNQVIAITHSPYLVNLNLLKCNNRLLNLQMTDRASQIFPKADSNLRSIGLKDYNFKPEIFFSKCNIIVEGPGDEAAIAAISSSLNDIFEKLSIHIINVGGKDTIEKYVPILEAYSIPHVALTDYDYLCDEEKHIVKPRKRTTDFIILPQRLEEELYGFDSSIKVMSDFDLNDPCKTSKADQPKSVSPIRAYEIVLRAMSDQRSKVKLGKLGQAVDAAITKAGGKPNEIW